MVGGHRHRGGRGGYRGGATGGGKTTTSNTQTLSSIQAVDLQQHNKADKNICGYCNLNVTEEEDKGGLMCDLCKYWVHYSCENIQYEEYEYWKLCPRAKFYCKFHNCEQEMENFHDDQINGRTTGGDLAGNAIGKSLVDVFDEKLNDFRMEILQAQDVMLKNFAVPSVSREEVQDMVKQEVQGSLDEHFEREKRRNNVVIFGIEPCPEEVSIRNIEGNTVTTKMTSSDKRKFDLEKVQELKVVHEDLEVKESDVKQMIRLGKSGGLTSKGLPKYAPIRISFVDGDSKWRFLSAARNLKSANRDWMKKLYVSSDLTQRQHAERETLRNELHARMEAGETDLYISKGRIMKKPGNHSDRLNATGSPGRGSNRFY